MAKKPAASATKTKSGSTAATKAAAAAPKKSAAAPAKKPAKASTPAPAGKKKPAEKPAPPAKKPAPAAKSKAAEAPASKPSAARPDKSKPEAGKKTAPAPAPKPAPKAVESKAPPTKGSTAKPPASKPAEGSKAPAKSSGKSGAKDAKSAAPAPNQPRFRIPFAGSITDEKAAAAKLSAAAGLSHIKKTRSDILVRDENAPRLKKSPLSKKQLQEFRDELLVRRAQIVRTLQSVESEALSGGSGSLSHLPQHMADAGSDTYDQSLALGIADQQRTSLRDIDAALQRIEDNTYGICELLGTPIDLERLRSQPWTKYSIEGARESERLGIQR